MNSHNSFCLVNEYLVYMYNVMYVARESKFCHNVLCITISDA